MGGIEVELRGEDREESDGVKSEISGMRTQIGCSLAFKYGEHGKKLSYNVMFIRLLHIHEWIDFATRIVAGIAMVELGEASYSAIRHSRSGTRIAVDSSFGEVAFL